MHLLSLADVRLTALCVLGGGVLLEGASGGEALAVRVLVHSTELLVFGDPQLHEEPHDEHDNGSAHGREGHSCHGPCNLLPKQHEAAGVDKAAIHGEEAREDGACDAAHAVQAHGVQGVVHVVNLVQKCHRSVAPRSTQQAHCNAPSRRHEASSWRDANEPSYSAHGGTHAAGLAIHDTLDEQPGHHGAGSGDQRGRHGPGGQAIRDAQRGAAVEAQPAEPKQGGAEDHEGSVCRAQLLLHVSSGPDDGARHVARHAGADVHDLGQRPETTLLASPSSNMFLHSKSYT